MYQDNIKEKELKEENNSLPKWLKFILVTAGISITIYLFIQLIEYLSVSNEKSNPKSREKKPRIFISHSWTYDKDFNNLITRFKEYGFQYYDHSIPQDKALDVSTKKDLFDGIERKMMNCSKFIILAGNYVNSSETIKEEIKIAKKLNKEIIAIRPWGINKIPKIIVKNADVIIGTNTPNIIRKIKNYE